MSRLEEIKAKPYFNKETRTDRVNSADIVWLINRVEELEKFKREAEYLYKNYHLSAKKSAEEKERYKQALEEIRGLYPLRNVGYQVSEIRKIVIKALEGER